MGRVGLQGRLSIHVLRARLPAAPPDLLLRFCRFPLGLSSCGGRRRIQEPARDLIEGKRGAFIRFCGFSVTHVGDRRSMRQFITYSALIGQAKVLDFAGEYPSVAFLRHGEWS